MPTDQLLPPIAVVAAAILGACGPRLIAVLPEPESADADKRTYASLASVPRLALLLAVAAAALMAAVAWLLPVEVLPVWAVFLAAGASLAYVDARTRLLPFALTAPLHLLCLVLVALAALLAQDLSVLVRGVVANLVVFVVFWVIWAIGRRFGGGAFGYGDVRLAAIIGLVLGAVGGREVVVGCYASFVVGAVAGVVLVLARRVDRRAFAFGPALVLGAVLGIVVPALT